ncbi:hypothetical protein H4Q32_030204 [Labeo rohita]|uniref:Uncharacterized protein n=1 Tax=Labeo rohita TaxID=84645 RepID=A0ABQ8MF25_LABRO|nr:hypothetical protein H4Q32_030204 [Labeo rohita]
MDQQVQEELLEANMQTEGSRGKERAPSEVTSKCSLSSSKSSVASAAAKARASAEAARAKMAFAKRQLEMKKEKARLEQERATVEANLEALELERDAAAALAEAEVLEAAAMEHDDNRSEISTLSSHVISKRTEEYVKQQTQMSSDFSILPLNISSATCAQESAPRLIDKSQSMNAAYDGDTNTVQERNRLYDSEHLQSTRLSESPYNLPHSLPNAAFKASPHQDPASKGCTAQSDTRYYSQSQATPMLDFAKFIARRELVTTGLTKFDDNPENFRAWESSFVNATKDLQLSASEELDLLVKWLGKESSDHVRRIRAVYVTNPQAALQMSRTRLHECYATPEVIERALFTHLDNFPCLSPKDNVKLRELADLLMEMHIYLDYLTLIPLAVLLLLWRSCHRVCRRNGFTLAHASKENKVSFPPFSFFTHFIFSEAKARNDPSFKFSNSSHTVVRNERPLYKHGASRVPVLVHKTDVSKNDESDLVSLKEAVKRDLTKHCPIHNKSHPLLKCRAFRKKSLVERKNLLKEHKRCFRCCSPNHVARECLAILKCAECDSDRHCTVMHPDIALPLFPPPMQELDTDQQDVTTPEVTSKCTEVCGESAPMRSCAKMCLMHVFPREQRERAIRMYAIIDDQSNRSLAKGEFFQIFGIQSNPSLYLLRTCAGSMETAGRKAVGFQIETLDGKTCLDLPPLIECNEIMSNRSEIPTPEVALAHPHLKTVAQFIPKLDPDAQILVLLGRDMIRVHKVRQQINGPHDAPFAQRLDLGWVIVGDVCIERAHKPMVSVFKTHILDNGRPSLLTPCQSHIKVKEKLCHGGEHKSGVFPHAFNHATEGVQAEDKLGLKVFDRTKNDNKPAMSFEDETFLEIMQAEFHQDEQKNWVAPLPFRSPRPLLPNNREQALSRLNSLRRTLSRNPEMKKQFSAFMEKLFQNHHAERAPPIYEDEECWYLPIFGVYHPQKRDK